MANKSKRSLESEAFRSLYFKWEFLRRNNQYRKDCDAYLASTDKNKGWALLDKFYTKYAFPPLDYRMDLGQLFNKEKQQKRNRKYLIRFMVFFKWHIAAPSGYSKKSLEEMSCPHSFKCIPRGRFNQNDYQKIQTAQIKINLAYPKEQILNAVEGIIDSINATFNKKRKLQKKSRKQLEQYRYYCMIYDLKKTGKMSDGEIVKKVYPKECEEALTTAENIDYDSLLTRVRREYKVAKNMINGGYRQIR